MKKTPLSKQGTRASRAWVWPLAACALVCSPEVLQAVPLATGIELQAPVSATISKAEKINPTTVELTYADGKMLTLDFYGENIFRLFRDDNGGIIRDPQATPPAKILVDDARR